VADAPKEPEDAPAPPIGIAVEPEPPAPARAHTDDAPVPRLPRGRGIALSTPALIRIAMFATLLVAVIVMRRPCADNVAHFVGSFDTPDAGPAKPAPPEIPPSAIEFDNLVPLPPGSTDDDIRRLTGRELDAGAAVAPAPSVTPDSGSAH
jgi:hypothetical protein